jgi:hypothetical protein
MKIILDLRRILATTLFISGVVLYFLFATCHPLLHNHHEDGEHHHNCPACNFLATASNVVVPEVVIVPSILYPVDFQIFFDSQQSYLQPSYKSNLIRGPPLVSV